MTDFLHSLAEDARYALRMLRKSPGFTLIAVATLALGIGANTALFSVVSGVLLNPLPYPHADQLVTLHESKPNFPDGSISYLNFRDWQKENQTFSAMAISFGSDFAFTGNREAEQLRGQFISSDLFRVLGISALLGRTLERGEDEIGAAPVALISEGLWRRRFDSASNVLGKNMTLDGRDYTIVGVIPAGFDLLTRSFRTAEVYVGVGQRKNNLLLERGAGLGFHGIARLKPGVTLEQARADMDRVSHNLAVAYPDADKGIGATVIPLKTYMVGNIQPFLLVLLGAVGFVLLIACVNVANLLLARSTGRSREFAVRAALGASQSRVVRQLLTESALLALCGGSLGILLAAWGTQAALQILPAALPRSAEIRLDARVLIFTAAVSLLAGILFGLIPALRSSKVNLQTALQAGGRGATGSHRRTQGAFIVFETATALVLLIGAGLMIRSLTKLWNVDPGFDSKNVLTVGLSLPPSMTTASPAAIRAAFREVDEKFGMIAGVQSVSQTWGAIPMSGDDEMLFWLEGEPKPANQNDMHWAIDYIVGPDYLKTMSIPLLKGRFLTSNDSEHAPRVAVIDDVFAHKFFGDQNPIGKRINFSSDAAQAEIVGVVAHVKQWGLDMDDSQSLRAELYLSWVQMPDSFIAMAPTGSAMVIRSTSAQPGLFDAIRQTSAQISSQQVVYGAQSMDSIVASSLATRRFAMILLGAFAALALGLAVVGIYGVISYLVGERTREVGIRMALGARPFDIARQILAQGGKLALLGILLGGVAALALTRLMSRLLYGITATDPLTFVSVAVLLAAVALAACYIPARRASRVDPMVALRYE